MKVTPILLPFDDTEVNQTYNYILTLSTIYKHNGFQSFTGNGCACTSRWYQSAFFPPLRS